MNTTKELKEYDHMIVDSKGNLVFVPKVKRPEKKVVPVIKGTRK